MKESAIQKKIIDYLEGRDFHVVKIVAATRGGEPDLICCSPGGRFMAIEVKTETGRLSDLQAYKLEQIVKKRGVAIVAFGYKHFVEEFAKHFPTLV